MDPGPARAGKAVQRKLFVAEEEDEDDVGDKDNAKLTWSGPDGPDGPDRPDASPDGPPDGPDGPHGPLDGHEPGQAGSYLSRGDDYFRGLYQLRLDFKALAEKDADFAACLQGRSLDFTNPASVMQLTKTLLRLDFGLQIDLPPDRLCPPVPNRHNYILWLKELLDSTSASFSETYEPARKVVGLDIGTGASAIYPLLGCAQRPSWSFTATDNDPVSVAHARRNVKLNGLEHKVRILDRAGDDPLIPPDDELDGSTMDFVMTNPPFYASEAEMLELAWAKAEPANSACTGAPSEMVCDGGETTFVRRLLHESVVSRERVQWYTSMLGKQSSLEVIVDCLRRHGIDNYAVAEFVQGRKTRRWAIGWSFVPRRPSMSACRAFDPAAGKKILPHPTEFTVAAKVTKRPRQVENILWTRLEDAIEGLHLLSWSTDQHRLRAVGSVDENVWSRAYRRRTKGRRLPPSERPQTQEEVADCAFVFSVTVHSGNGDRTGGGTGSTAAEEDESLVGPDVEPVAVKVLVRWLQGVDYVMFESFCAMLKTAYSLST